MNNPSMNLTWTQTVELVCTDVHEHEHSRGAWAANGDKRTVPSACRRDHGTRLDDLRAAGPSRLDRVD